MTRRNVIVLTPGLAGSSLFAGLIADSGYWAGGATFKKIDYDTYENPDLITLNQRILSDIGYCGNYERVFRAEEIQEVAERAESLDPTPYRDFVALCNRHQPWLWKDPRLWLTIRYWQRYLDANRTSYLLVTREQSQAWVSQTIRHKIQTPDYCLKYIQSVRSSILEFLDENELKYLELVYENLVMEPKKTIFGLNEFIGSSITMETLSHINRGRLYQKQHGVADTVKAVMIYLRNYSLRYR